jgi:hypothetical protein
MKSIRTSAAAALTIAVIWLIAPRIGAYVTYGAWPTPSVSFYVNPANADVSESAATSALQAGMNVWNSQSGTPFRFNYAGRVNDTTTGFDNRNVILFRNESNGSTIATTYAWASSSGLADTDIVFWDGGFTFFTGSSGCTGGAYIEDIAAHELGHALGLGHSTITDATMYPYYSSCSTELRSLASDDIAGAKSLYGNGSGPTDTPPTVKILSPSNGASAAQANAITFSGSATDVPDGDISSKLIWRSNIDGQIGTGASFSRTLSAGTHTISASATDSIGYTIIQAIVVYVTAAAPTNTAPTLSISSPASGTSVVQGTALTFSGSASDSQDGSLTGQITWFSSVDGSLGTGSGFSKTLSAGSHVITAIVTDSGGLSASQQVSVTVTVAAQGPPPPPPTSSGPTLTATGRKVKGLQTVDLAWANLSGSSVDIYRNGSRVMTVGNNGRATDNINQRGGGSYAYKACDAGTSTCTNQANVSF